MKIVLDIAEKLPANFDLIAYDTTKGKWVAMSRVKFLEDTDKKIFNQDKKIEELEKTISDFKNSVNEKLLDYHNVLQTLVKENN